MAKNKGIFIDRNKIWDQINDICSKQWKNYTLSDIYDVGNSKRIDIVVDHKTAFLNLYFNNDGTTTIQVVGKNTEISELVKLKLEDISAYRGNIDNKTCSFKNVPQEWSDKLVAYFVDNPEVSLCSVEIDKNPAHTRFDIASSYGDKLVINKYKNGTLVLQGKPAYIFGEAIAFLSYCKELSVDDIVYGLSEINNVSVKTEEVHEELKKNLKNSYFAIDSAIIKMLSPSIALQKVSIELEDYSCFVFPALRALEGYIKWLLATKNVVVGDTFGGIFVGDRLAPAIEAKINDSILKTELEKLYKYYKGNRHVRFHAQQMLMATTLIEKREEADSIIKEVLLLIDSSYKNVTT